MPNLLLEALPSENRRWNLIGLYHLLVSKSFLNL
jgi:hypothetical protein